MPENTSIEKNVATKQAELLADALEKAKTSQGYWLNKAGRLQPSFYNKKAVISPFNALLMGLHADKHESKTSQYVLFSESRKNGYPVKGKETGVPFNWARFENYVHRHKPETVISRDEYLKLEPSEQELYKAHPAKEVRVAFNLSQTVMPHTQKEEYEKNVKEQGGVADRPDGKDANKDLRVLVNDYILKLRENLCDIRKAGTDVAYYDSHMDNVILPSHDQYPTYEDYVQDMMRSTISATGHPQRLGREAMIQGADTIVNPDAENMEKLVEEVASAVKMQELGLPAKLSNEGIGLADFWVKELRENPMMVNKLEADVNSAVAMVNKAARGEKVELGDERIRKEAEQGKPLHYAIADKLRQLPDKNDKIMVVVLNGTRKKADVILPAGASEGEGNEIPGMSKKRIESALKKQGVETVSFYNVDGALSNRHDDSFYRDKDISTQRLNKWDLERLSTLDISDAVKNSDKRVIDNIQIAKESNGKWMMFIKPENQEGFGIYADSKDLQAFFAVAKQGDKNNIASLKQSIAEKYMALVETHPELKTSFAGDIAEDVDPKQISKSNIYKDKEGNLKCYVQLAGMGDQKFLPRPVTQQQFQRLFIAVDKTAYKQQLGAILFPDLLRGQNIEENLDTRETKKRSNTANYQIHVTPKMVENWLKNAPGTDVAPEKFENVVVSKDDEGKWVGYVKPEGQEGRSVYPQKEDLAVFFDAMKNGSANMDDVRQTFARKAYVQYDKEPKTRTDLFKSLATESQLAMIDKANIYKSAVDEQHPESKIFCSAVIDGERQKPKEVSNDQWQRMWLAPNMQQFKKNLAGTLYLDVLKAKENVKVDLEAHQEDKECTRLIQDIDGIKEQLKTETDPHKQFDLREQMKLKETQLKERVESLKGGDKPQGKDKEQVFDIPEWAVDTIMKGDDSKLTADQKKLVNDFLDKNFADGFVPEIMYGAEKASNKKPAFGTEPAKTVAIKFGEAAYFESRSDEKKEPETKQKEEKKEETKASTKDSKLSPLLKQYIDLKSKHPDALLLFRTGDFYETYMEDAEKSSKILGITLTKSSRVKDPEGKPLAMAGFPYHALDAYLPKIIRAGQRVAICDQIEAPRQKAAQEESPKETKAAQEEEVKSHGFHR